MEDSHWISVKDRLPKVGVDVFVWMESGNFSDYCIARMTEENEWYRPFKNISDVTHWQPLPKPPKQIKQ